MIDGVKVLLSAERDETTNQLISAIRSKGMSVELCHENGTEVLNAVKETNPDVIIMGAFMRHIDGLGVLRRINMMDPVKRPLIIILSSVDNDVFRKSFLQEGADYYFTKSVEARLFAERIVHMMSWKDVGVFANFQVPQELDIEISETLQRVGIPVKVKGYRYIREAIHLVVENPTMINYVTTILYPTIAKKFETTPSTVERAMRYAIKLAWDRGSLEVLTSYFGYAVKTENKPTNSEFVMRIADALRFKRKTNIHSKGPYGRAKNF